MRPEILRVEPLRQLRRLAKGRGLVPDFEIDSVPVGPGNGPSSPGEVYLSE